MRKSSLTRPRHTLINRVIDKVTRRGRYPIEQITFFFGFLPSIILQKPDVIFLSDYDLARLCSRWRRISGQRFRILFCNGGPTDQSFERFDLTQHPVPANRDTAIKSGEPEERHVLLPLGGRIVKEFTPPSEDEKMAARRRLGLPLDREVILIRRADCLLAQTDGLPC